MSSATPHRIDPPSTAVPRRISQPASGSPQPQKAAAGYGDGGEANFSSDLAATSATGLDPKERSDQPASDRLERAIPDREGWLRLHATDLIDRLQSWASDLDAREAQLNSRTSIQEHRERRFRLRQQDLATELAEQQRSIDRLRLEIEAQARRLAFQNDLS